MLAAVLSFGVFCADARTNEDGGHRAAASSAPAQARPGRPTSVQNDGGPASEEIRKSFRLAEGDRVEVWRIAGPVEVETWGGAEAEVHVVRSAATRRELDCYRTAVGYESGVLFVRHEQFTNREGCRSISDGQRVSLRLPRSADLSLDEIAGDVTVGESDGVLRLSSIAGRVRLNGVRSGELRSLAKGLALRVEGLEPRGLRVESVVGAVELALAEGLDADLSIENLLGNVTSEIPRVQVRRADTKYRAQLGAGGPRLSLTNVNGNVRLLPLGRGAR